MPKKNEVETVTLPALPVGRCYVSIASEMVINIGCGVGTFTFHPGKWSEATLDGTVGYGGRQCGTDGGALGKDATDKAKYDGALARCVAIDANEHVYGKGGGGARLTTYMVVLREFVSAELQTRLGMKKGPADKAARDDSESAYLDVAEATANTMRPGVAESDRDKVTTEAVMAVYWPKLRKAAKDESDRRDKKAGIVSVIPDLDAILAAATESEDNPADEKAADAA